MFEHTDSIVQVEIRVEVDLTARRNSLIRATSPRRTDTPASVVESGILRKSSRVLR